MWKVKSKQRIAYSVEHRERDKLSAIRYPLNAKRGFTLIELLVITSILGMIALAVFSTFAGGLNIYKRMQSYGGVQADVLLSLEKVERDLRNTVNFSGIGFVGDSKRISFPGLVKYQVSSIKYQESVGKISYYFDDDSGALIKEKQDYSHAISEAGPDESDIEELAFVESINFGYYYFDSEAQEYGLKNVWNADDGIPDAVGIEIIFKDGKTDVKLVRTVLIPISV